MMRRPGSLVSQAPPMLQARVRMQAMAIFLIKIQCRVLSGYGAVGWETIAGRFNGVIQQQVIRQVDYKVDYCCNSPIESLSH